MEHLDADVADHAAANRRQRAVVRGRHRRGTRMNQSWSGGYVADVPYLEGFYLQQSPARMALTCMLVGVVAELPAPTDEASYIRLGCGVGIGALMNAGSHPCREARGIDYNSAHMA